MPLSDPIRLLGRLACFLPLGCLVILTDWFNTQDPVQGRVARELYAAADALVAGNAIASTANLRDLKPIWAARLRGPRDVLVLGGSRLLPISEDWFRPQTLLNAALFEGDLDDMVAMFRLCVATQKAPRLVILDLNPTLTLGVKSSSGPVLALRFREALLRYRIFPLRFFDGFFLGEGIRWDVKFREELPVWSISEKMGRAGYCLHPDGSTDWARPQTSEQAEAIALANTRTLTPWYRRWRTTSQPAPIDRRILRAFLDELQARGIRTIVLLAPLHPAAYDIYTREGGYDDGWIRREMENRHIPVIGSYSPAAVGASRDEFFDDVHPHGSVLRRLLSQAGIAR